MNKNKSDEILDISIFAEECTAKFFSADKQRLIWKKNWQLNNTGSVIELNKMNYENFVIPIQEINNILGASAPNIRLIMPDFFMSHVGIELENIPSKKSELDQIIYWRLQEEFYINPAEVILDYSTIDNLVSIFYTNKNTFEEINELFIQNNLIISAFYPYSMCLLREKLDVVSGGVVNFITLFDSYASYGISSGTFDTYLYRSEILDATDNMVCEKIFKKACRDFISSDVSDNRYQPEKIYLFSDGKNTPSKFEFPGFDVVGANTVLGYCK